MINEPEFEEIEKQIKNLKMKLGPVKTILFIPNFLQGPKKQLNIE